ncbi:hypothetical protein XELAEV_18019153mg [Xenopus laevis]|uniref:SEA domain-containing protein n=1 Tax=Xenopus laevis TaxID=8355 RepID=A0A974DF56_XENLA|nr:hypothetical protein XELAEV_18019153mg [Xenopus laevis]
MVHTFKQTAFACKYRRPQGAWRKVTTRNMNSSGANSLRICAIRHQRINLRNARENLRKKTGAGAKKRAPASKKWAPASKTGRRRRFVNFSQFHPSLLLGGYENAIMAHNWHPQDLFACSNLRGGTVHSSLCRSSVFTRWSLPSFYFDTLHDIIEWARKFKYLKGPLPIVPCPSFDLIVTNAFISDMEETVLTLREMISKLESYKGQYNALPAEDTLTEKDKSKYCCLPSLKSVRSPTGVLDVNPSDGQIYLLSQRRTTPLMGNFAASTHFDGGVKIDVSQIFRQFCEFQGKFAKFVAKQNGTNSAITSQTLLKMEELPDVTTPDDTSSSDVTTPDDTSSSDVTTPDDTSSSDVTTPDDTSSSDVTTPDDTSSSDITTPDDTSSSDVTTPSDTSSPDVTTPDDTSSSDITTPDDTSSSDITTPSDTSSSDITTPSDTSSSDVTTPSDTSSSDVTTSSDTSSPDVTTPSDTSSSDITTPSDTSSSDITTPDDTSSSDVTTPSDASSSDVTTPSDTSSSDITTPSDTSSSDVTTPRDTSSSDITTPSDTSSSDVTTPSDTSSSDVTTSSDTSSPDVTTPSDTSSPDVTTPSDTSSSDVTTPSDTSSSDVTTPSDTSSSDVTTPIDTSSSDVTTPSDTSSSDAATSSDTSTITVTTSASKPGVVCKNGGYYDGTKCVCKQNFYGRLCELISSEIRPEIITKVDVTVTVENEKYDQELNNTNSPLYKNFDKRFQAEMKKVYEKVPNYQHVEIISIKSGSIIVKHLVVLQTFIEDYDTSLDQMETILNATNCTDNSDEKLCFKPNTTKVVRSKLNVPDACLNDVTLPAEVRKYYVVKNISGAVSCVSNCSESNDYSINCNNGQCSVTLQGPLCFCTTSDQFWYTGSHCQMSINKLGVYAGVPIATAALIITIVTLSIFLHRRKGGPSKERLIDEEQRWYEDGFEGDNNSVGSNWNPGAGNNADGSPKLRPPQDNFHPVLSNVDTSLKV